MRGGIDNIKRIQQDLASIGLERNDYYIHADAALSGMIMPFVDQPHPYSFEDGIDSISVSGHKMIGSPMPCGIVLAKRHMVDKGFDRSRLYLVIRSNHQWLKKWS